MNRRGRDRSSSFLSDMKMISFVRFPLFPHPFLSFVMSIASQPAVIACMICT